MTVDSQEWSDSHNGRLLFQRLIIYYGYSWQPIYKAEQGTGLDLSPVLRFYLLIFKVHLLIFKVHLLIYNF